MVIANTTSGATRSYDITDRASYLALQELISSNQITALAILQNGIQHVLPMPRKFRGKPQFGADLVMNGSNKPVGECIFTQAGDVRVTLTSTFLGKLVRCDLVRTGRMRYNPDVKKRTHQRYQEK